MKKRLLWIIELFIWLMVLFIISGGVILVKYNYKKIFNTYQIFLPDVDGLIKGSPVKFMGINIGYVSQIDIVGEDVYVKFIVTEPKVRLPEGSIATVEFAGLGGSKSLELYPPIDDKIRPDKFIITQSPKRIHDSLGLLSDMFDQISDITYYISHFVDKLGIIKIKKTPCFAESPKAANTSTIEKVLDNANNWLDKAQKQCDKVTNKLTGEKNGRKPCKINK